MECNQPLGPQKANPRTANAVHSNREFYRIASLPKPSPSHPIPSHPIHSNNQPRQLSTPQPRQQLANPQKTAPDAATPPHAAIMAHGLFDDFQIATAMQNEAMPALERLAGNSSLRDHALRRFDRDDPPPYTSSTEDDYDYEDEEDIPPPDELSRLLDEPLNDLELGAVAFDTLAYYQPGGRYDAEVELERDRIDTQARVVGGDTRKYFVQYGDAKAGRAGQARINIIARRNIKRRWQKLGVWNPKWGIPERRENPQPNDDTSGWKWPWQHGDAAAEWRDRQPGDPPAMERNRKHPVTRALELRRGMRLGEHSPTIPRSRLGGDASASQAESFITSRPWFLHELEVSENVQRKERLPEQVLFSKKQNIVPLPTVKQRWTKRGDWKDDWPCPRRKNLIGWKWRHESPSPEPEDRTCLEDPTLDLTPSEVDALEAIRPPTPPSPRIYVPPTGPPYLGMFGEPLSEEAVAEFLKPRPPPPPPPPPVRWARLLQIQQEVLEQSPPPRQTRRRRSQGLPLQPPPSSRPTLRRSARIAAKTAAVAANTPVASSRVSKPKPPPRPRGRARGKKTTQ